MLQIIVLGKEVWNEESQEFEYSETTTLNLEHSLVSISKWESIWHKPFFSRLKHTEEETKSYIQCMTINHNVNPAIYNSLSSQNVKDVVDYIENPMSAIQKRDKPGAMRDTITSEKIYSWMFAYNVPIECERWHIARLLNVIDLLNEANTPNNKRSQRDVQRQYASLNAQRRAAMHSKG